MIFLKAGQEDLTAVHSETSLWAFTTFISSGNHGIWDNIKSRPLIQEIHKLIGEKGYGIKQKFKLYDKVCHKKKCLGI